MVRRDLVRMLSRGVRRAAVACGAFALMAAVAHAQSGAVPLSATVRGPDDAPVTIVEFSDFQCPFCSRMVEQVDRLQREYPDKVRLVFKHNPLSIHADAPLAHEAALAAAAQGKFWPMHDLLFANQDHLGKDDLVRYATGLGLDVAAFSEALRSHAYRPIVERDLAEAAGFRVVATPTLYINGTRIVGARPYEELKRAVDVLLGNAVATDEPETAAGAPDVGTAPTLGPADAPITIVEYSDFQCPFCARALPVIHQLLQQHNGLVRVAFKDFPLSIHPDAPLAHSAAAAAAEQGKFWEMHDALFHDQARLKRNDLIATAQRLGLDVARFRRDLDDPTVNSRIAASKQEGARLGITGTPTFFVNGKRLVGALPVEDFNKVIDAELQGLGRLSDVTAAAKETPAAGAARQTPVSLVWFADVQSSLNADAGRLVRELLEAYGAKLALTVKHGPLDLHPQAQLAHEALAAAQAQDKFWDLYDRIAANRTAVGRDDLVGYARAAGLNGDAFATALDSHQYRAALDADRSDARWRDVRGTPTFFVNGKRIDGLQPLAMFRELIDAELKQQTAR
jgi:protein-disulfide isomerase